MADEPMQPDETPEDNRSEAAHTASELEVRPARPEDRDAVLAFCAQTWADGDYIAYVWDDWLKEDQGVLLVGLLDGQPVAINHMRMVSDDEAWLEGMRVDPAYRREGFGRILTSRTLVAAREHGATVARLITGSDNVASQGMIARFGFVRVAEMVRYRGPALAPDDAVETATLARPGPDDFERLWEWLVQSNLAPLTGGLEYFDWQARALTEPLLRGYLAAGQVRLIEEWGAIQALAVVMSRASGPEPGWRETTTLNVRYMDGLADSIGRMALSLRAEAATAQCERVELWLPDLLILRDAMAGAGYEGDDETMLVFARDL
ncbi:MAG TPA: GNAT family N-acetyltransferase [Ktedonobacterales bacterium]|nr:GNAT family N-acetyltransferase [Ktedonobacterales bacterium]